MSRRITKHHYDFIIVGSGFGGSVAALRLAERGYDVLVIERGRRFRLEDFPKTNWDLRRWFWQPRLGMRGIFQLTFLPHVTILHGTGVGGGSLVYAASLPVPKEGFFDAPSWAHLADWRTELAPHYATAQRMLGVVANPKVTPGDRILQSIAEELGRDDHFFPTEVGVYFGEPDKRVPDPYFDGDGPERVGCTYCGGCMTGCRVGAKNSLDRNYLFLAERRGAQVLAETEVHAVWPAAGRGYRVEARPSLPGGTRLSVTADRIVFAGGVLGTVPLLLRLKEDGALPRLSSQLGHGVRTNSEALFAVVSPTGQHDFSEGVSITSILHTDEHSHVEPVRYAKGSGFWRSLTVPHAPGPNALARVVEVGRRFVRDPLKLLRVLTVPDYASQTQILLYMRSLEGTLSLGLGRNVWTGFRRGLTSQLDDPTLAPTAFMPAATDVATRFADKIDGVALSLVTETLLGIPSTAHILGGCCMGEDADAGVIDTAHRLLGYDGLYVIDGAAVSANPGVNPSLTIAALAERACSLIPPRG